MATKRLRSSMWAGVLGLALVSAMGCAEFDSDIPEHGEGGAVVSFPEIDSPEGFETVVFEEFTPAETNDLKEPEFDSPCNCGTEDCLADWVGNNFGCDICVSFVCNGEPSGHACNACDDPFYSSRNLIDDINAVE